MRIGRGGRGVDRKKIEVWLEESLVPVEPSPAFVRELRARLVTVRGDQILSPWVLIVVLASIFIVVAGVFGFALRLLLGLLGLIGLMERRRRAVSA